MIYTNILTMCTDSNVYLLLFVEEQNCNNRFKSKIICKYLSLSAIFNIKIFKIVTFKLKI